MRAAWQRLARTGHRQPSPTREAVAFLWTEIDHSTKTRLALAIALVLASSLLAALAPVVLKVIVDDLTVAGERVLPFLVVLLVAAYAFSQWLARGLVELQTYVHALAAQRILRRLSRRLFAHVIALPLCFHLQRRTGATAQTLGNGLLGYRLLIQHVAFSILPVLVELLMIGAVLVHFRHGGILGILTLSAAAYALAFGHGLKTIAGPARSVSSTAIHAAAVMTDSLLNHETIKLFGCEPATEARYDHALAESERSWQQFYRAKTLNGLLVAAIMALSLGAPLLIVTREVIRGGMTIGDFVLINTYVLQLVRPLETLGYALRDMAQGIAFIEKMMGLLRLDAEGRAASCERAVPGGPLDLVFEDVTFSYHSGHPALSKVNFSVPVGRTVALVGPTGAGKSTIVRLLLRLFEPDSGRILLGGAPVTDMPLSALRRSIAVVPQDTVLFDDTITFNIAVGRPESTQAEIDSAARQAHIHEFITSLPEGYGTTVGERGLKLSGGEKQRITIARAVLMRPRVWILDEATASLDGRTEREVLRSLAAISKDASTLMITHRLSAAAHADEILVISRGTIVERGRRADLLARDGHFAALWRAQYRKGLTQGLGEGR